MGQKFMVLFPFFPLLSAKHSCQQDVVRCAVFGGLADVRVLQMPPPSFFAAYVFGDVRKANPHSHTTCTFLSQSFFPQCTLPPPATSSCRPRDSASVSLCGNSVVYWPKQSIISVYSKNWQLKGENLEFILPFSCKLCFRGTQQS